MAEIPAPAQGLVVRYNYLWRDEHLAGREQGSKDRPAVIVIAVTPADGPPRVAVLPVTHSPPVNESDAVALPQATARRLGLDDDPMWIVTTQLNLFNWPGFDLKLVPGVEPETFVYGMLPYNLTQHLIACVRTAYQARAIVPINRDAP